MTCYIHETWTDHTSRIKMTSHEIRNPLGAVIHCADLLLSTLTEMADFVDDSLSPLSSKQRTEFNALRDAGLDAVETIISCSSHQKRRSGRLETLLSRSVLILPPLDRHRG